VPSIGPDRAGAGVSTLQLTRSGPFGEVPLAAAVRAVEAVPLPMKKRRSGARTAHPAGTERSH